MLMISGLDTISIRMNQIDISVTIHSVGLSEGHGMLLLSIRF